MPSVEKQGSFPVWIVLGLIAVAVIAIGSVLWQAFRGSTPGIPDRQVHAGMYDFKKEAANGNLGRRQDTH